MKLIICLGLFSLLVLSSCAGPMNPFGAINAVDATKVDEGRSPSSYITTTKAKISFLPGRQNWHRAINFRTKIEDENGIGPRSQIRFFYNEVEVTDLVKDFAEIRIAEDGKSLFYAIEDFRLSMSHENRISVSYQRDDHSAPLIKHYEEPRCPIDDVQKVQDHGPFESEKTTFNTIEKISIKEGINPSLLAGLIAQESGFNSKAISWAKAIGLTQVTSLAESHVIKKHPEWPRYQGIQNFSYPRVKSLILMGKINEKNEWRLNKELSIKGGIEYLRFVESYWSMESNKRILEKVFPDNPEIYEEVVLASYNSGPFRVKKAITKLGKNWLRSNKLNEARKYVKKVKSYCYHFSNSGEAYAPFSVSWL